jgi:hypothetical protein
MTTSIIHDNTPTGEIPTPTTLRGVLDRTHAQRQAARDARRHAWIAEDRPTGRHRAGRGGSVHVTAIAGVDLARRPVRLGAGAKTPTHGLLARLLGGGA